MEVSANLKKSEKLNDHLRELGNRFIFSLLALVAVSTAMFFIYPTILDFLRAPLSQTLYYDSPAGSLAFILKICMIGALAITMPILVYNIVMFIRPAFAGKISRKQINTVSLFSGFLALSGMAFGYYIILPESLRFFSGFQVNGIQALISADNYLNFITNIFLTFILVFQIPLIISFINRIKPISPSKLLKGEKWVVLGSVIIGLIVPFSYDLVTSLIISLPIIVLYNISFIIIVAHNSRANKKASRQLAFEQRKTKESRFERVIGLYEEVYTQDGTGSLQQFAAIHSKKSVLDIQPMKSAPAEVTPAAWVIERRNRMAQPMKSSKKTISDIRPRQINNRLASA